MKSANRKAMYAGKRGGRHLYSNDFSEIEKKVKKVEENSGIPPKTATRIARETARVADKKTKEVI